MNIDFKEERKSLGMTQDDLAKRSGVAKSTLRHLELHGSDTISLYKVLKVVECFDLDIRICKESGILHGASEDVFTLPFGLEKEELQKKLGTFIKDVRFELGISQKDLSDMSGVGIFWLCHFEKGSAAGPGSGIFNKLLSSMNYSMKARDEFESLPTLDDLVQFGDDPHAPCL